MTTGQIQLQSHSNRLPVGLLGHGDGRLLCLLILAFSVGVCVRQASAQAAGITTSGAYTLFRTGSNEPLQSLALPFDIPGDVPSTFSFEFGFATAEPDVPETFFDSFSMTLQSSNQTATALFLTADRSGVAWVPPTPGMLSVDSNDVVHGTASFPSLPGVSLDLPFHLAYSVTFLIPAPFAGGPLSLFFDLFDNLNAAASMAYVKGLRLDATGDVSVKARFYRLRSDLSTRLDRIRDQGPTVLLEYHFLPRTLELHAASSVRGPYTRETNASLEAASQTFSVDRPATNRFYRVFADAPARIMNIRLDGGRVLVEYDFESQPVAVESALNARSAFREERSIRHEPPRRKLRVPKPGQVLPPL
jgi:hypothetical protein